MMDFGLTPLEEIIADGAMHRFATKDKRWDNAGWCVLHADEIPHGAFGCWRKDESRPWIADIGRPLIPEERSQLQKRIAEFKKKGRSSKKRSS